MLFRLIRLIKNHNALGKPPKRKGQRVILLESNYPHVPSHNYPIKGSNYACEGTITSIFDDKGMVIWDNGQLLSYPINRLQVCDLPFTPAPMGFYPNFEPDNPNIVWKRIKLERYGQYGHVVVPISIQRMNMSMNIVKNTVHQVYSTHYLEHMNGWEVP
jgi:hypothetical protein